MFEYYFRNISFILGGILFSRYFFLKARFSFDASDLQYCHISTGCVLCKYMYNVSSFVSNICFFESVDFKDRIVSLLTEKFDQRNRILNFVPNEKMYFAHMQRVHN